MQFTNRLGGVASGATVRIDSMDESSSVVVPFMSTADTVITPPPGWIYRMRSMFLWASPPAGATFGTHAYHIIAPAGALAYSPMQGRSSYNRMVQFNGGGWTVANDETRPTGPAAQQLAVAALIATEDDPLTIRYFNDTDADQVVARNLLFTFERIAV